MLQVGAVVCGVDPNLSYYKVQYASMCLLLNPGCLFIATNTDARGHFTPNLEWAGAGATVGAIKGKQGYLVSSCVTCFKKVRLHVGAVIMPDGTSHPSWAFLLRMPLLTGVVEGDPIVTCEPSPLLTS
jgi:hypothetical protein